MDGFVDHPLLGLSLGYFSFRIKLPVPQLQFELKSSHD